MPPHFHAWYGEYKVIVNINDGVVKGEMPRHLSATTIA